MQKPLGDSSTASFRVDGLLQQLANPNLHDIPRNLPFRVEMWDQPGQHVRWVISASASVAIGHAALDAAIANYPEQHFTLRDGVLVIRQHPRLREVWRGIMSTTFFHAIVWNCERSFGCRMMPAIQRFFGRVSVRHVLF
jgi:hypothetical protein